MKCEIRGFADINLLGEEGYQKSLADIEAEKIDEPASRAAEPEPPEPPEYSRPDRQGDQFD